MVAKSRKGLGDLLKSEAARLDQREQASPEDESANLQAHDLTDFVSHKVSESRTNKLPNLQSLEVTESVRSKLPKYLQLIRKETRLRPEQYQELTLLARQLSRASAGRGERITENTLIRLAVDLLLNQKERLQGTTEEELLANLRNKASK